MAHRKPKQYYLFEDINSAKIQCERKEREGITAVKAVKSVRIFLIMSTNVNL